MGNNESNPPQLISNPELRQIKCQNPEYMQRLLYLEYYLFNLNDNNFEDTACKVLAYFDPTYSFTWTAIVFNLIFTCFHSNHGNDFKIYVNFIINLTEKIGDDLQMMERFVQFLCDTARYKQEAKYFLQMLIESDIIKPEKVLRIRTLYFSHYKTEAAIKRCAKDVPFYEQFFKSFDELKKDNWKLHKNLVHDGVNPSQIALIIRNDNIEKLQEMSTQANFDFNQKIEPSLYERCSLVNQKSVSLINYSAFFGSVKCFKFLLQNDCDTSDACKYAIAGGNFEILQLCEQYHLSFDNTIETAIEYHRNQMIKYLYENKIVICNDLSQIGFLCVIHRNYEILAYLESYGMLINDKIMNKAAIIGNLYLVKHFVEGNKIPKDILPYAAFSRNVEVVRYVLTFEEIDLNAKDDNGYPALINSQSRYNKEIFSLLLNQYTIDVNIRDVNEYTPFVFAASSGNTEALRLILQKENVNVNAKNKLGHTALFRACLNGYPDIVKILLNECKIDIRIKSNDGKTALFIAVEMGRNEIVDLLLEHGGFDVNSRDNLGDFPLYHACNKGYLQITKTLLQQKGININAKNKKVGITPLIAAATHGYYEIIQLLLEQKGIDVNAKDDINETALMTAAYNGLLKTTTILLQHKGINLNAKDDLNSTALIIAAKKGYFELVKLLLEQKGINTKIKNTYGNTAFMEAVAHNWLVTVKIFLENSNVDINDKGEHKETALHKAITVHNYDMVNLFLQRGININAKDELGETALFKAIRLNEVKIANLLLQQNNIEINVKNNDLFFMIFDSII